MGVNTDYPNIVSGRISDRDKALMEKYDFSVRDAVEMYIHFRTHPKVWRTELIKQTKMTIQEKKSELAALESKLNTLSQMDDDL